MLGDNFKFQNIDLDTAQFLIAIVLDFHGQYNAAKKIMNFCKIDISKKNKDDSKIDEMKHRREFYYLEFLYIAKKTNRSFLETVITAFFTEKLLAGDLARNNVRSEKMSLNDMNIPVTPKDVYNDAMILLTSPETIIIHYMRTNLFFVSFKKWLKRKFLYDVYNRKNDLSDAKCKELLVPVINRTRDYFASQFDGSVSTPDNFIFNSLDKYFKDTAYDSGQYNENSDVNKFYKILNSRGQDRDVEFGDDSSTTALSFVGLNPTVKKSDLNFKEISIKICKASTELYTHKNSKCAFYDIFSRYRDLKFKYCDAYDQVNKYLKGCLIEKYSPKYSFTIEGGNSEEALLSKCSSREEYLTLFNNILIADGVSMREIKTLYDHQIEVSKHIPKRENRCLYKVDGSNVKGDFSNSGRFKNIFDGFIALKDFINFIYSEENVYGITVNNFDTSVFRDPRLANVVRDIESYVLYGDITSELVSAEDKYYDGVNIKSNSEVQTYLNENKIFNLLRDTPLIRMQEINNRNDIEKQRKNTFNNLIKKFSNKVKNFTPNNYYFNNEIHCASDLTNAILGESIMIDRSKIEIGVLQFISFYLENKGADIDLSDARSFKITMEYLISIEVLMTLDGVPMLNENLLFDYEDPNITLNYLESLDDSKYVTKNNGISTYQFDSSTRLKFIDLIFKSFFKEINLEVFKTLTAEQENNLVFENSKSDEDDFSDIPYWQKLIILFSISNFMSNFLVDLGNIGDILRDYNYDNLLVYIKMCEYLDMLNLEITSLSLNNLYNLYGYRKLVYQTGDYVHVRKVMKIRDTINKYVMFYYNKIFSKEDNRLYYKLLKQIRNEMYDTFKPKGSLKNANSKKLRRLDEIADDLRSERMKCSMQDDNSIFCNDEALVSRFNACATLNDAGYAMYNDKIFISKDGYYLHSLGTAVKLKEIGNEYDVIKLNNGLCAEYELLTLS